MFSLAITVAGSCLSTTLHPHFSLMCGGVTHRSQQRCALELMLSGRPTNLALAVAIKERAAVGHALPFHSLSARIPLRPPALRWLFPHLCAPRHWRWIPVSRRLWVPSPWRWEEISSFVASGSFQSPSSRTCWCARSLDDVSDHHRAACPWSGALGGSSRFRLVKRRFPGLPRTWRPRLARPIHSVAPVALRQSLTGFLFSRWR